MMLVVVLHSAQVYNPLKQWLIYSENPATIMKYVASFTFYMCMPAFFVVSGFFCYLALQRYNIKKFFKTRVQRLFIPFLTTAVTLNSIQVFMLNYTGWRNFDLIRYLTNGGYVSHLWFLINLMIYFIIAAFITVFFKKNVNLLGRLVARIFFIMPPVVMIILLPLISIGIIALGKLGLPLYIKVFGFIDVYNVMHYLPYFGVGMVFSYKPELICRLRSGKTLCLLLCIVFTATMLVRVLQLDGLLLSTVEVYYSHLCSWTGVAVCFYFFHKFMNNVSDRTMFLSDASYTVYLFHHVLVVFFGLLCIRFRVSALVGVPVIIIVTFAATLLIHKHVIQRFPLMRYLFNGK